MVRQHHLPKQFGVHTRHLGPWVKAGVALKLMSALILFPHIALGQDAAILKQRVERLERDLNTISRQVYRGGAASGANSGGGYPPASGAASAGGGEYNEALENRIDGLEQSVRSLTGQVEALRHDVDTQRRKMDKALGDIEFRFQQMAKSSQAAPMMMGGDMGMIPPDGLPGNTAPLPLAAPLPAPTASAATAKVDDGKLRAGVIDNVSPRSPADKPAAAAKDGTKNLAALPVDGGDAKEPKDSKTPKQVAVTLPEGGLQEQYDFAFGLLKNFQFDKAESAFKSFLQKHGESKLAANAQYWLAETYYGRDDYKQSVLAFAESYKKYPTGPKGPDSLLKLGMSLGRMGQKAEACLSLDRLKQEYPSAAPAVLQVADQEKKTLACSN